MKPYTLFAACLPGLEELLGREMQELGFKDLSIEPGGIEFAGHRNAVYRANLELGLATHVLVRVGTFATHSFPDLFRQTARLPWRDLLLPGERFDVHATCRKSRLYHSGGVEERVALAVLESLGDTAAETAAEAPSEAEANDNNNNDNGTGPERPVLRVRIAHDVCTISLDSTGTPLWRRGYKLDTAKAPLREDLARALVLASGWDRVSPLVDPFAGSGTIVIEAALLARRLAPGRLRRFAFERTALYDAARWAEIRENARGRALDAAPAKIHGSDRDAGTVEAAQSNAARAGVAGDLVLERRALRDAAFLSGTPEPPPAGALVTNPPYGRRLDASRDLGALYQTLGKLAGALPEAWRIALLAARRRLALRTGLRLETAFLTDHGGLKVRALVRK